MKYLYSHQNKMTIQSHHQPPAPGNKPDIMATLPEDARSLLFSIAEQRQVSRKEQLLKEGQVCTHIHLIRQGSFRTFYNKDGREINLQFSFENSFVTNLKSLRTAALSENYIEAMEKSVIVSWHKDELFRLYEQSADITAFGRKLLEQLLYEQEEHATIFKLQSPKERYQYIELNQPQLLQRVSLTQLSSFLGISRETLSRIRKP